MEFQCFAIYYIVSIFELSTITAFCWRGASSHDVDDRILDPDACGWEVDYIIGVSGFSPRDLRLI